MRVEEVTRQCEQLKSELAACMHDKFQLMHAAGTQFTCFFWYNSANAVQIRVFTTSPSSFKPQVCIYMCCSFDD